MREHPVGTNAFQLAADEWKRSSRIVLTRYPGYRDEALPLASGPSPTLKVPQPRLTALKCRSSRSRCHACWHSRAANSTRSTCHGTARACFDGTALKAEYATRGIRHQRRMEPSLQFQYFNMSDPVVGGMTLERSLCAAPS